MTNHCEKREERPKRKSNKQIVKTLPDRDSERRSTPQMVEDRKKWQDYVRGQTQIKILNTKWRRDWISKYT